MIDHLDRSAIAPDSKCLRTSCSIPGVHPRASEPRNLVRRCSWIAQTMRPSRCTCSPALRATRFVYWSVPRR